MLANGATLQYSEVTGEPVWKNLPGLKEIPDVGVEPEKVENTPLSAKNKQYENGVGDLGDMKYKFVYDNTSADSPYRILRKAQEDGKAFKFKETTKDGTSTEFTAQPSVKRTGGALNGVIECEVTMAVQSDLEITDPA